MIGVISRGEFEKLRVETSRGFGIFTPPLGGDLIKLSNINDWGVCMYFFHDGNEQRGPFTLEELKGKSIKRETPVWKKGLKDWTRAGELPELSSLFENTPPSFRKQVPSSASKEDSLTEKTGQKLGKFLGWTGLFKE